MTERKIERRGLGRGLSALMADVSQDFRDDDALGRAQQTIETVPVGAIFPNPDQPRRDFDQTALAELAASIKEKGVLQPVLVRRRGSLSGYEIVAGERRWRAAQIAEVHEIPIIIRDYDDTEVLEVAIIENVQREDLNPVEEAAAFRMLTERFGHTQERLAEALGKSRSYVANSMRLLTLPDDVLGLVRSGRLSAGHARALVTSDRASAHAARAVAKGLTVRDLEKAVQSEKSPRSDEGAARRRSAADHKDADTRALESDLAANLGMAVHIAHEPGGEGGKMSITYRSLRDLDMLCRALSVARRDYV